MDHPHQPEFSDDRIQTSFLAEPEKKVLLWIASKLLGWISPVVLNLFIMIVFIKSAYKNLTKLNREERANWNSQCHLLVYY